MDWGHALNSISILYFKSSFKFSKVQEYVPEYSKITEEISLELKKEQRQ